MTEHHHMTDNMNHAFNAPVLTLTFSKVTVSACRGNYSNMKMLMPNVFIIDTHTKTHVWVMVKGLVNDSTDKQNLNNR